MKLAKQNDADAKLQTFDESSMTINTRRNGFLLNQDCEVILWDCTKMQKHLSHGTKNYLIMQRKLKLNNFIHLDLNALNLLEKLNCPIYKIASFEATDLELIKKLA